MLDTNEALDARDQLLHDLDAARAQTLALLDTLEAASEPYPGWTVKEFLAHLTGWDDATTAALRAHAEGKEPDMPAYRGIDFYNAETVSTRAALDYPHVKKEWQAARELLKGTLRDLPAARFTVPVVFPWGPTGSVSTLVEIMIHHEHEHAEELRTLLAGDLSTTTQGPQASQWAILACWPSPIPHATSGVRPQVELRSESSHASAAARCSGPKERTRFEPRKRRIRRSKAGMI